MAALLARGALPPSRPTSVSRLWPVRFSPESSIHTSSLSHSASVLIFSGIGRPLQVSAEALASLASKLVVGSTSSFAPSLGCQSPHFGQSPWTFEESPSPQPHHSNIVFAHGPSVVTLVPSPMMLSLSWSLEGVLPGSESYPFLAFLAFWLRWASHSSRLNPNRIPSQVLANSSRTFLTATSVRPRDVRMSVLPGFAASCPPPPPMLQRPTPLSQALLCSLNSAPSPTQALKRL